MSPELRLLLIPAMPALGALILGIGGQVVPRKLAGWIGSAFILAALLFALPLAVEGLHGHETHAAAWPFFATGALSIDVAFHIDALSGVMLFVVLGVGFLIHFYSIEYMGHDPGVVRFFAYLNMFVFFMLLLILGDNLFLLFVGWEGVGLASYCLIGFWYENEAPPKAGIKAFLTNRVGDAGFMIGLLMLAVLTGSANFAAIAAAAPGWTDTILTIMGRSVTLVDAIALLLFIGACGKSAQFPLHVWLPDAMEGPTPVSALIHAATMVTAGVYMVARLDPLFAAATATREIMLVIAIITSLGAAVSAVTQTDLKRILAYSTISQLGYMMAGVAAGARDAAVFHLATHAVFKALLFLSAGSVMHAMSGALDIRSMGGLFRRIPITSTLLIVGAAGLAGVPLFAGFYSKDMIVAVVAERHPAAAGFLLLGALITAFYSARMVVVALFGAERFDRHTSDHLHESGWIVLGPLLLLALGTVTVGYLGQGRIPHWLGAHEHAHAAWVQWSAIACALGGLAAGVVYYTNRIPRSTARSEFIKSGFGLDALIERALLAPTRGCAGWVRDIVDRAGIDSIAHGLGMTAGGLGESMRAFQTGNLGTYLSYIAFGLAVIVWVVCT
jgi:NADH-quinone oxidoreductase subunit L